MTTACQAFISAGSNIGDRAEILRGALAALARVPGILRVESSSLYETVPVDVPGQPAFLNLAAGLETTLAPEELLARLQKIENQFGRVRDPSRPRGPRTLDMDLLFYEDEARATALLTLPHPRVWQRAFVLVPLLELVATHDGWMRGGAWVTTLGRLASSANTEAIAEQQVRPWPQNPSH